MYSNELKLKNAPLEGEVRIPSGCAVSAIIDRSGKRIFHGLACKFA